MFNIGFRAQIYNKMRKVDKKNSRVLTGAADQQSKNHILQKEFFIFITQAG
jgi:hypothetical protein